MKMFLYVFMLGNMVTITIGQKIPCSGADIEECLIREESIASPNSTVTDGTDMTFTLRATGNFTNQITLEFPSTDTDKEKKNA